MNIQQFSQAFSNVHYWHLFLLHLALTTSGYVLFAFLLIFTIITIAIYVEEVIFIMKAFKLGFRKKKTIYVLSVFPVRTAFSRLLAYVSSKQETLLFSLFDLLNIGVF
jgi:hypothetical protein